MVEKNLSEVCQVIAGQSPPSSSYNQDGIGIPFFQGKADFGEIYPTVRYWCTEPKKLSSPGDILFSVRAPVGPTNINQIEASIGRGLAAIRCGKNIDQKYLLHYLRASEEKIAALGTGSTFSAITIGTLKDIKIHLPPLSTQKKIAAILDAADAHRQKTKQLLAKYDELAQSIFLEMFGDPVTNPKGLKIVELGEVTTKITDGVHAKPDYMESGVPFISVKDITTGELIFENCKYVSQEAHRKYFKRCNPEYHDILYTKVGATYGRPAIVDVDFEFSLYVSVALIKPKKEILNSYYLKEAMANPAIKRQADKAIKGIGVPDLHLNMIKKFLVPLPSILEQEKFSKIIEIVNKQRETLKINLIESENLFNSLLQKAFKGELVE